MTSPSDRELVSDTTETLPTGFTHRHVKWSDGSALHIFSEPEGEPCEMTRRLMRMNNVSANLIGRLEKDADGEDERHQLMALWDEQWSVDAKW